MGALEIRAELLKRGVRLVDIANKLGVDRSLVSHVLSGRERNVRVREAIASELGVSVSDLFASEPA